MPDGIEWGSDEIKGYLEPIQAVDNVLSTFARRLGSKVDSSTYRGYISRTISFQEQSTKGSHFLVKSIHLTLKEKRWPPVYELWLTISANFGLRDLLALIPFIRAFMQPKRPMRWETTLRTFSPHIDPEDLTNALNEAKNTLDAFDERQFSQ